MSTTRLTSAFGWLLLVAISFSISLLPVGSKTSSAQDFTVRSTIFAPGPTSSDRPVAENTTVFFHGRVYDQLQSDPGEACYFDPQKKVIEVLAPARRVRTAVALDELLTFVSAIEARAMSSPQSNPLVRFAASPHFKVTHWDDNKKLRLAGDWLEYEVRGESYSSSMVSTYQNFADWFARLNVVRHQGALPPAARLEVNRQVAERGWLPIEIQLTLRNRTNSTELRSRHSVSTELTDDDRALMETIDGWRGSFRPVDITEFGRLQ